LNKGMILPIREAGADGGMVMILKYTLPAMRIIRTI
jgi:hypothetical protein